MITFELKINIKNNGGRITTIRESFQAEDLDSLVEDLREYYWMEYKKIEIEVISQENQKNCPLQKNNTDEHIGVYWYKKDKKGVAFISINGKLKHLGLFDNLDDAIKARKDAEVKYGYHKNHGK